MTFKWKVLHGAWPNYSDLFRVIPNGTGIVLGNPDLALIQVKSSECPEMCTVAPDFTKFVILRSSLRKR